MRDFTTAELQRVAQAVVRRYLDVRSGGAPATALQPFLTPAARTDLSELAPASRTIASKQSDLGAACVLRLGRDRAAAVVAVQTAGAAPSVVAVELEAREGRLRAARVGELSHPNQTQRPSRLRVGPDQPLPEAPAHLTGLLGDLPAHDEAVQRWVVGAAVIDTYRERHGIDEPASALGPIPDDLEQQRERERALACVQQLSRQIDALTEDRTAGRSQERPGPELGR